MSKPTTSNGGFLETILERPDEDGPRLAWADALQGENAPRGAFVRVQCELAQTSPWDESRIDLEVRQDALLREHYKAWMAPIKPFFLEPWSDLLTRNVFSRGMPENLVMRVRTFRRRHEELFSITPVRHVLFTDIEVNHQALASCPALSRLRSLGTLASDSVNDHSPMVIALAQCPYLQGLTELEIMAERLTHQALQALVCSPHLAALESLVLTCAFPDPDLFEAMGSLQLPSLRTLIFGTPAPVAALRQMLAASWLSQLHRLSLDESRGLRDDGVQALAACPRAASLRVLNLGDCQVGSDGIQALASSPHLTQLENLGLAVCRMNSAAAAALAQSPSLRSLRQLDLSHSQIRPAALGTLVSSAQLPQLRILDLSYGGADDSVLTALASGPLPDQLTALNLGFSPITDAGIAHLANGPVWKHLAQLDVTPGDLGPDGIMALVESPSLQKVIDLSACCAHDPELLVPRLADSPALRRFRRLRLSIQLTDALAGVLAQSPHLDEILTLHLRTSGLSHRGRRVLRERFGPRLLIF